MRVFGWSARAGLSMEDALVYWQREFTKGMSGEEFVKRYAYNIRYNYGKEGKRSDFSPYSCVKIITASAPAGDEVHGERVRREALGAQASRQRRFLRGCCHLLLSRVNRPSHR